MPQVASEAIVMTKMTARLMPTAVSIFFDTPRKGQMPKNRVKTKLLMRMAPKKMAKRLDTTLCLPPILQVVN